MDPVTELATRVATYLWRVRDVYPAAQELSDVRGNARTIRRRVWNAMVPERNYPKKSFSERREPDFALLARIGDAVSRTAEEAIYIDRRFERYPVDVQEARNANYWKQVTESFRYGDQVIDSVRPSGKRNIVGNAFTGFRTLRSPKLTPEVIGRMIGIFPDHVVQLRSLLPKVPIPGGEDPRVKSKAASTIPILSKMLLQTEPASGKLLLWLVAEAINYVPSCLRGFPKADLGPLLSDPNYPKELIEALQTSKPPRALPFALVLDSELNEIGKLRRGRGVEPPGRSAPPGPQVAEKRAFQMGLLGVCFSGGGIRSATLGLGAMQALAAKGWLRQFDYLSTVSGGGYIGAWLAAWIKRVGSVQAVEQRLARSWRDCDQAGSDPDPSSDLLRPVRMLREYSNYLAPQAGLFTADTWTMMAIWVRNTLLNLAVLALFLAGALGLPHAAILGLTRLSVGQALTVSAILLLASCLLIGYNLLTFETFSIPWTGRKITVTRLKGDGSALVAATIGAPLLASAYFATCALWISRHEVQDSVIFAFTLVLFWIGLFLTEARIERLPGLYFFQREASSSAPHVAWAPFSALAGAILMTVARRELLPRLAVDSLRGAWLAVALGPTVILGIYTLAVVLYLGLLGYRFDDFRREWWSRLGAWLGLLALGWTLLASISFFGALLVAAAVVNAPVWASSIGAGWAAITAAGTKLGFSGGSGKGGGLDKNPYVSLLIKVAPLAFVFGFLIVIAFGLHVSVLALAPLLLKWFPLGVPSAPPLPFSWARQVADYWPSLLAYSPLTLALSATLVVLALLLSLQVDVNEFSMHHFYRNRLVRAYLGASRFRRHRQPNQFTGLDPLDDVKLWRFQSGDRSLPDDDRSDCRPGYKGPYPILNATLNLTGGEDLAWQERKAHSFVFTPHYCGYDLGLKQSTIESDSPPQYGLRPTDGMFGLRAEKANRGMGIGTAVAISGAAVSPNWGYHSSPAVAFLLTIFNVRLGWWLGNPSKDKWLRPSPRWGLVYLLHELAGYANADRKYVYLSDGGHFDNMGLYELVRRRCRLIILCDGEEDAAYTFEGLGNAIRKCRLDFGVEIVLDPSAIRPQKDSDFSSAHWAIGTIRYPDEDGCGRILYVKSSLTGNEPADVIEYRCGHKEFPHQSTADQFFDESQFESYRALGQHIVAQVVPEFDVSLPRLQMLEKAFNAIDQTIKDKIEQATKDKTTKAAPKGESA